MRTVIVPASVVSDPAAFASVMSEYAWWEKLSDDPISGCWLLLVSDT